MILIYIIVFHEKQNKSFCKINIYIYIYIYILYTFLLFNSLYQHFKHFVICNYVDSPLFQLLLISNYN